MAIALEESLTTTGNGSTLTLASWSPAAYELLLVAVHAKTDSITPTVAGNGLTWVSVITQDGPSDGRVTVFRAMGSSAPSSGAVTVTLTGNSDNATAVGMRFSGVDTSGTDGSGAIGATNSAQGSNTNMLVSVTSTVADSIVLGSASHSNDSYTLQAGETAVSVDLTAGSGGGRLRSSTVYEAAATVGSYTIGGNGSMSGNGSWGIVAIEVLEGVPPAVVGNPYYAYAQM